MELKLGQKLLLVSRIRFLEDIPLMYETLYLDYERFPNIENYITEKSSLYQILKKKYKLDITGVSETLSIAYCDEKEAYYLELDESEPVIYQSGITFDDKKIIFEYFKSIIRSEYVCFTSELKKR
jgi:GntR family transcriptional regulator